MASSATTRGQAGAEAPVPRPCVWAATIMALGGLCQPFVWVTPSWPNFGLMAVMGMITGRARYLAMQA